MKKIIIFFVFLIALETVFSMPGIPSDFYGTVKIGGQDAPIGTVITAYIDGQNYGSFTVTVSGKYGLFSITGDDPDTTSGKEGGVNGDTLTFKVNGQTVTQTGIWQQGESVELNLALTTSTGRSSSSSITTQIIENNESEGNTSAEENQEDGVKEEKQTSSTETSEIGVDDKSSEPEDLNILKNEKKTNDYDVSEHKISTAVVGWIIVVAILVILIFVLFKRLKKRGIKDEN